MAKKFTHRNESFLCFNCQKNVPKAGVGCRDHCPHCLFSLHVDINPGDRENTCQGILEPISYESTGHKGIMIHYRCKKCQKQSRVKALLEDKNEPDCYEQILKLIE